MRRILLGSIALLLLGAGAAGAQQGQPEQPPAPAAGEGFRQAASGIQSQLEQSLADLDQLRGRIVEEKLPLSRKLSALETELSEARQEFQDASRQLDRRTLELNNLRDDIQKLEDEATYLPNLFAEYTRNFEPRLHIAELQRYTEALEAAKLAAEDPSLSREESYRIQAALLATSLARLEDALGGTRFEGAAVTTSKLVEKGTFVLIGPAAIFGSADGSRVGTAEQVLGSLQPAQIAFVDPQQAQAASRLITSATGEFPFDPSLGDARKIESTEETFLEHIQAGGLVMIPIFVLAGAALLVALIKWISLLFVRVPSQRKVDALLEAVAAEDREAVEQQVSKIRGPFGRMLRAGVDHMREPRELIEEVMYETVLKARLAMQRFLPFVAISAAAAPLLGLLGTVTGIIKTFQRITVFGAGDVKTLSGGISEALITTEYGLIVAIPSLLLHAFLSRKARRVVGRMEITAVAFLNQVSKTPTARRLAARATGQSELVAPDPEAVRAEVREVLAEMLGPLAGSELDDVLEPQARPERAAPRTNLLRPQPTRTS